MTELRIVLNDSIGMDEYLFEEVINQNSMFPGVYNSDILFASDFEAEDEETEEESEEEEEDLWGDSPRRQRVTVDHAEQAIKLAKIFSGDEDVWLAIADYQPEAPDISLAPFLPIFNLTPENFELFSRDLVQAIHPTASVHRYGVPGNDQEGIDLYADHSDKKVFDYQCKRHKQFGPADIDEAVKTTTLKANKHYLLLTRRATADARKAIRKHKNWDLWDLEDVAAEIRRLPQDDALRIVDTYFPGWRKKFLGKDDPSPWLPPEDFFLNFLILLF